MGQIAEVAIYSGVLSSLQISNIEAQLTAKYVTANTIVIGAATVSPTNNTYAGNPVSLGAPVIGATPTTTFQWQTDNASGGASFSNIGGATTTNYVLNTTILGALSTISPFAIDMYLPAFPQVAAALHTSTARISLSLASYFAGMAAGQLFYGPLLDRLGRRLPLYAGLILFIAASMLCLCSRTVEWLIAMRFIQGLGGCGAQVAAMAMVRDFFPVRETAKIISLLSRVKCLLRN